MGFQQKVVPIDAFQFTGPDEQGTLPDGIVTAQGGTYVLEDGGMLRPIRPGQYVVRAGEVTEILSAAQFDARYEAVPVEAPADETSTEG